jgi:hypothetical protein
MQSILFRPTSIMALQWFCNPLMAVRFCRGAPISFLGVVKWYHSWFGAMWRGFDSLHRDQYVAEYGSGHPLGLISQESGVRIPPLQPIR